MAGPRTLSEWEVRNAFQQAWWSASERAESPLVTSVTNPFGLGVATNHDVDPREHVLANAIVQGMQTLFNLLAADIHAQLAELVKMYVGTRNTLDNADFEIIERASQLLGELAIKKAREAKSNNEPAGPVGSRRMILHRPAFSPKSCYLLRDQAEVDYFTSRGGAPEAALITWARSLIKPDEAFIDVGAHVGSWAQDLAQHCARVHAFEPQSTTLARLEHGVEVAGLDHVVRCWGSALGDKRGYETLSVVSVDGGGSTLRHRAELGPVLDVERVYVDTLDVWMNVLSREPEILRIGLIKLDVEGAEIDVIAGARAVIMAHRPQILAEAWLHPWFVTKRDTLIALLTSLDYDVEPAPGWPEMLWARPRDGV